MPIKDCPFLKLCKEDIPRPILPINIINPHTGLSYATFGIIDTGADECAIPAGIATLLGHNLQAGSTKIIGTGNGETIAFAHTTKFEIYNPVSFKLAHTTVSKDSRRKYRFVFRSRHGAKIFCRMRNYFLTCNTLKL